MHVALLGTGTMGAGMARSLLRSGIEVTVWNRHIDKARPLAGDGATVAETVAEAVAGADVVLTMLFDETAVAETAAAFLPLLAEQTRAHGPQAPRAIWMQSATVGIAGTSRLAELAAAHGVAFVDAPVVGTKKPAEEGALVVLLSGEGASIQTLQPVLDAVGSKTVEVGPEPGAASALKLACNAWVASLTAATAQSVQMCRALGIDPALFLHAIDGGASNTPYLQLKGGMMLKGDFTPAFALDGLTKDLGLMQEAVAGTSASSTILDALHEVYARASAAGHGSEDIAAVMTALGDGA